MQIIEKKKQNEYYEQYRFLNMLVYEIINYITLLLKFVIFIQQLRREKKNKQTKYNQYRLFSHITIVGFYFHRYGCMCVLHAFTFNSCFFFHFFYYSESRLFLQSLHRLLFPFISMSFLNFFFQKCRPFKKIR